MNDRSHLPGHLQNIPDYMLSDGGHTGSKEFQRISELGRQANDDWAASYASRRQRNYSHDGGDYGRGYNQAHREWQHWADVTDHNIRLSIDNYRQVVGFNSELLKRLDAAELENARLEKERKWQRKTGYWAEMLLMVCIKTLKRLMSNDSIKNLIAWTIADQYAASMIWHRDSGAGTSEGLSDLPHACAEYLKYGNNKADFFNDCIDLAEKIKTGELQMTLDRENIPYQGINPIPESFIR